MPSDACIFFQASLKHFKLAEEDDRPCTFSPLKIRFHTAHLHEVQGESAVAKDIYEDLIKDPQISQTLKADVYRQLGWMYHSVDTFGEKTARIQIAIQVRVIFFERLVVASPLDTDFAHVDKIDVTNVSNLEVYW